MNENTYEMGLRIWERWMAMWNGRPELALDLVAARFALHLPQPSLVDEATIVDPATVNAWVAQHCARFRRLVFHYEAGPYVDAVVGVVSGPWWADAETDAGARIVAGMDVVAFREARIHEYWTVGKDAAAVGRWTKSLSVSR